MTWKALRHPNISSLLGVTMTENQFAMVSEWMDNGNINEFVKAHPDASRPVLVRFPSCFLSLLGIDPRTIGIACRSNHGVNLHARPGNISRESKRGTRSYSAAIFPYETDLIPESNILIDNDGRARLTDFGLIALLPGQPTFVSSYTGSGTVRWMSPETLSPDEFGLTTARPTRESDCYALGMVIYEVLSGRIPFSRYNEFTVVRKVLEGERPDKPEGARGGRFPGGSWEMLECCWEHQPKDRPRLDDVLFCLRDTTQYWVPPSNTKTDEEGEEDGENEEKEDWNIDFDD